MQVSSTSSVPGDPPLSDERFSDVLDLVAAVLTVALVGVVATGRGGVPRILLTLGFAFYAPGRAIVTNWPKLGRWSQVSIAIALSLVVLALVAMISLWEHRWSPLRIFYAEAAFCLAGLSARQFWHLGRRGPRHEAAPVPQDYSLVALFDAALSDAAFSDTTLSDAAVSDAAASDAAVSNAAVPDAALSDATLSDAALSDAAWSDEAWPDEASADSTFSYPAWSDAAWSDAAWSDEASSEATLTFPAVTDEASTGEAGADETESDG